MVLHMRRCCPQCSLHDLASLQGTESAATPKELAAGGQLLSCAKKKKKKCTR